MAMIPQGTTDKETKAALLKKITATAKSMKRENPTALRLPNGGRVTLTSDILDRLAIGDQLKIPDWVLLGGVMVAGRATDVDIIVSGSHQRVTDMEERLQSGQKRFRIVNFSKLNYGVYLRAFSFGSDEIKNYSIQGHDETYRYHALEYLGIEQWKAKVISHQETSSYTSQYIPFQDAILFDMLLDLALDNFRPHTRTIEDGPAIQLEILEALARMQREVEVEAGVNQG
ncbi:hypothetical protein P280DRAFT_476340 [Massarina eburnea CBS 473.64]|uniref:Uncharacterized protein n=1 Tax=Massarina eburnea CBS 473.64 TaxID=1395130 RepID=A0A6A6SEC6_9PLEO|nr:hypothetical protein P280DRAFT_476340 [Massarina eburnea CBS 473.64]